MAPQSSSRPVYGAKQLTVNGRVVNDLTDREFIALFAKRSGMYLGRTDLRGVVTFLTGFDTAASRYGNPLLDGYREWLIANYVGRSSSFAWSTLIELIALPERDLGTTLTTDQESKVLAVLFDLLDKFLAERETPA